MPSVQSSEPTTPALDEFEVSLFGPGYGESVVIHIGNGRWVIVDSCIEPKTGTPAPLHYLNSLGVDTSQDVRLIVATHWHDDHVRGISTILNECDSAKFAMSSALNSQEFYKLLACYVGNIGVDIPGLVEFSRIIETLKIRKKPGARINPPIWACSDRTLYSEHIIVNQNSVQTKICSLSPSDASITSAKLQFAKLLPTSGGNRTALISLTPNRTSVVLWVEVAHHKVLLGADHERTVDPMTGWSVILQNSTIVSGKASAFKVPHHGAESSHEPLVWSNLLSSEPQALLTPFYLGGQLLPTPEDIRRILSLTSSAYITAPPLHRRHKFADNHVREFLKLSTRSIHNSNPGWGHIRLRCGISESNTSWKCSLFGDAVLLNTIVSTN